MKFGIGAKIVVLLVVAVSLTGYAVKHFLSEGAKGIVILHELGDLSDETMLLSRQMQTYLTSIGRIAGELQYSNESFQEYLSSDDSNEDSNNVVEQTLNKACQEAFTTCAEQYPQGIVRLEAWLSQGQHLERIAQIDQNGSATPGMIQTNSADSPVADFSQVIQEIESPGDYEPFLSRIGSIELGDDHTKRRTEVVWAGILLSSKENDRRLYVGLLVDLRAPLPNGEDTPLKRLAKDPRHISFLANEPLDPGNSSNDLNTIKNCIVSIDRTKPELSESAELHNIFKDLFQQRNGLNVIEELVPVILPKDSAAKIPSSTTELDKEVYFFRQSEIIADQWVDEIRDKCITIQNSPGQLSPGTRISAPLGAVGNVRILANDLNTVNDVIAKVDPEKHLKWCDPVPCDTCTTRYALFSVPSAGMKDNLRFYGFARSVFDDEMDADVQSELTRVWDRSKWVVLVIAALAGILISQFFTRPLAQITNVAREVGQQSLDPNRSSHSWQEEINSISQQLPIQRHDEIGVLANALKQTIGEMVASHSSLQKLNSELDQRVTERTQELKQANDELTIARDKAAELNRAKDAFLASVSHELRNPLNQVSGFCQLLELTDLDEDQLADLKKIQFAGDQLLALINDILDYQKIIMGGVTLEPETFQVKELFDEIGDSLSFPVQENQNVLQIDCPDDIGSITTDKQRLRQVLINLASNACKFTHNGSITIRAKRLPSTNGIEDRLQLCVADTGRGMTPEEQSKLFNPFVKLSAKKGNLSGTGLGLVISKGFCELMGGDIRLTSEFGKGSTFTVTIPVNARSTDPKTDYEDSKDTPIPKNEPRPATLPTETSLGLTADLVHSSLDDVENRTVLVIDDDPAVQELMNRSLSHRGFKIHTASSGLEGLELARKLKPAAITLDAIMPGLDGWAVLAALKADAELADIPVIMVTMLDNRQRGQIMGAAEFIVKPIDWNRLTHVLERFAHSPGDRTLLVVEDDPEAREILRRYLERDGWTVIEAEHGAAALEILQQSRPEVILLDLVMPVMGGFTFLEQLPDSLRTIPVIVITSKDPSAEELKRLSGQAARILQKGKYTQPELLAELHRRVDGHLQGSLAKH